MSFSYSGDPSASDTDAVRFEIHDTNSAAPLLNDAEVSWCVLQETGVAAGRPAALTGPGLALAAAKCCRTIALGFLAQADTAIGQLKITSTKRAEQYLERAKALTLKAQGFAAPYAGGQSINEKQAFGNDADAPLPAFSKREFSNPWTGDQEGFATEDFGPPVA